MKSVEELEVGLDIVETCIKKDELIDGTRASWNQEKCVECSLILSVALQLRRTLIMLYLLSVISDVFPVASVAFGGSL